MATARAALRRGSLARTTVLTAASKGIEGMGSVVATFLCTRYLGPSGFGTYAQLISAVMLLWPLVDMGLDHVVVRDLVRGERREATVGAGLVLRGGVGLAVGFLVVGWAWLGHHDVLAAGIVAANLLVLRQVSNLVCRALFLGVERVELDVLATAVGQAARLGGLVVAIRRDWGLVGVVAAPALAEVVQVAAGVVGAVWVLGLRDLAAPSPVVRHLVKETWSIMVRLMVVTAYFHVDNVVLARLLSSQDLGLFAAPFRVVTGLVMVMVPTAWALLPSVVRGQAGANPVAEVGPLASCLASLVGAGLLLGAGPLVGMAFGQVFPQAVMCTRLLSLLPALHTVSYVGELELLAQGRQQWALLGAGPALVVKVVADVSLAPHLGPVAGAASSLVADTLRCALVGWACQGRWMWRAALPMALLGAAVAWSVR